MAVLLQDNKVLLSAGKAAIDEACCCGGICCYSDGTCADDVTQEECEAGGGVWYSDKTSCDPNPCLRGACCIDNVCSIETESDCEAAGGTFLGEDVTCDPEPCIAGPSITLKCDTISASCAKCGFTEFTDASNPPKYYLVQTDTVTRSDSTSPPSPTCSSSWNLTTVYTKTLDEFCNCIETIACSGGGTNAGGGSFTFSNVSPTSCHFVPSGSPNPCTSACTDPDTSNITQTQTVLTCDYSLGLPDPPTEAHLTETITLSDEYTDAELISNTLSQLPAYSGTYGTFGCSSFRYLSNDDPSFSGIPEYNIERIKYKFTFASAVQAFNIFWKEHTVFDAGGESFVNKSELIPISATESSVYELLEPAANGYIEITDVVTFLV
jgi:hypothetical protein